MRNIIYISLLLLGLSGYYPLSAQVISEIDLENEAFETKDSLVYLQSDRIDTLLNGKDIFAELPKLYLGDSATVNITQDYILRRAFGIYVAKNASRPILGYRVRIYFDNTQNARNDSEKMMIDFQNKFPGVTAYRSYVNPYFKVTVGDYRTKSEALQLLAELKTEFPSSFIVKENIKYPVIDKENSFIVDTVKVVIRP